MSAFVVRLLETDARFWDIICEREWRDDLEMLDNTI